MQEGTPLVHDGVMFFPNPNDITQAIDAATGDLIWEYRRPVQDDNNDYIPFPSINRNLAIYGNLILDNGADNFAYALDARTGALAWETQILDYRRGAQHSSGPIVANGKVISGRSCEPEGGPEACVLTAFDAATGKEVWRTRTIPRPDEPGGDTWGNIPYEERRHVGLWMVPSFDPELNRIYVGTSVTSPAPKFMLAGNDEQYLYHNSTLAIDADTGKIVWYLQHNVDHWDLDHPFERILIDTAVAPDPSAVAWINPRVRSGQVHKVITGIPGKTGLVYTIDRETGQFLWARPTVEQNVIARVNTESGEGVVNEEKLFTGPNQEMLVCPSLTGGKNYHAGTYSPDTKLMYMPLQNICMTSTSTAARPSLDELYAIRTRRSDRTGPAKRRHDRSDLRRNGPHGVEARAARGPNVVDDDGERAAVRRRHGGTLPRLRCGNGRRALGSQLGLARHGLPRDVRRRRQAIHRHQHRRDAEHVRARDADAGNARGNGEQSLRVRAALSERHARPADHGLPTKSESAADVGARAARSVPSWPARSTTTSGARRSRATTSGKSRAAALAGA